MKNDKWGGSSSSSDLTEDPTDISVRFSRGLEHLRKANVEKAKQVFDDILREEPDYAPAFFGLSCVHIRLDAKELALKFLERALEIDPSYGEAHFVMARLLYDDGDLVGGYDHVKKAVQFGVSPDSGNELINSLIQSKLRSDIIVEPAEDEPEERHSNIYDGFIDIVSKRISIIIILAIVVRILYIKFVVPVDWVGDSYHHWQIAWYTLNIGLKYGRLWDLKGVEYYWPPLPSLVEAFLIWLFRTPSINLMRYFNILVSGVSIFLSYKIGNRIGEYIGETLAIILVFFPYTLNYEVLALHEPMMVMFALFSIYFYFIERDFYTGIFLALAYLCHFTVYVFAPIFLLVYWYNEKSIERLILYLAGFGVIYIPYAYILFLHTGDFLYNIRTLILFMGISTTHMINPLAKILGPILLSFSLVSAYIVAYKTRTKLIKSILLIFSGNSFFWGFLLSFVGAPISPYEGRYYSLLFILGILTFIILINNFKMLTRTIQIGKKRINIVPLVFGFISLGLLFYSIPKITHLSNDVISGYPIADSLGNNYVGGVIISPVPHTTYRLTFKWNIPPEKILGPIYIPTDYDSKMDWLERNNVTLLYWLPGYEADRVFPELSRGEDIPPFYILERFPGSRFIYEVRLD